MDTADKNKVTNDETLENLFTGSKFRKKLQTRYILPSKISPVFFFMLPWINVLTLVLAFVLLLKSQVVIPGIQVSLPVVTTSDGVRSKLVISARPIITHESDNQELDNWVPEQNDDGAVVSPMNLVVFFNDTRFNLSQPYRISSFRNSISSFVQRYDERTALLYLDGKVSHKDMVGLIDVLRDTGISNVCYVVKNR